MCEQASNPKENPISLNEINKEFFEKFLRKKDVASIEEVLAGASFAEREIGLYGDVTQETGENIQAIIRYWNKVDEENHVPAAKRTPIKIYIDTPGGSTSAMACIIDCITTSKTPVWTINIGLACSAGAEIFIVGHLRIAYPNSVFLFHEGSLHFEGDVNKFRNYSSFNNLFLERCKARILKYTKITEEEYDKHQKDDWWLFADEACEKGIADMVYTGQEIEFNGKNYTI